MATRLIQLVLPHDLLDRACGVLDDLDPKNWWHQPVEDDSGRDLLSVLVKPGESQAIMDALQDELEGEDGWRLMLLPVEALAPEILSEREQQDLEESTQTYAREEILASVQQNGALTRDFLAMVALSTVVAGIGLVQDQVAVVIGAMVIAPLLGPLMAFAFAVALGAKRMMLSAAITNAAGLGACVAASAAVALILPANPESNLLDYSRPVGLPSLVLPLASGAAAALAVATSKSSAFVGVMVAAALLPPIVAAGLLLAAGEFQESLRAGFTVAMNIVCITLAAQGVFIAAGIRPRRWHEIRKAETSVRTNIVILGLMAAAMAALLVLTDIV